MNVMVELVLWNSCSKRAFVFFLEICEQKEGLGFFKGDVAISYLEFILVI
jgi:hypothetical protein